MGENFNIQAVELNVVSKATELTGLDQAHRKLRMIAGELERLNASLSGNTFRRSAQSIRSIFEYEIGAQKPQAFSRSGLAKMLGLDTKDALKQVELTWNEIRGRIRSLGSKADKPLLDLSRAFDTKGMVRNFEEAVRFFDQHMGRLSSSIEKRQTAFAQLLSGGGVQANLGPGKIVPATQTATATAAQVAAAAQVLAQAQAAAKTAKTTTRTVGVPATGGATRKAGDLLESKVTLDAQGNVVREEQTTRTGPGKTTRQTLDAEGNLTRTVNRTAGAEVQRQLVSIAKLREEAIALGVKADPAAYAAALRRSADQVDALWSSWTTGRVKAMGLETLQAQSMRDAADLRGKAQQIERKIQVDKQKEVDRQAEAERAQIARSKSDAGRHAEVRAKQEVKSAEARRKAAADVAAMEQGRLVGNIQVERAHAIMTGLEQAGYARQQVERAGTGIGAGRQSYRFTREVEGQKNTVDISFRTFNGKETAATLHDVQRTLNATRQEMGLLSGDFVRNTVKVATWAASVAILYKTMEVATGAVRSFIETSYQTARLQQVFQVTGESARQLSLDVVHAAAVNGRSANEAQASAIQWSRLGLSRAEANEAVRASLVAANVAELSAAEATERLSSVYLSYGLRIQDLRPLLGALNDITNKFAVTNVQLLDGLSRSSAAARQAKMPINELIGVLGAAVGTTGQSGANMGNALKTVIGRLSNPSLQKKLRDEFKISVEDNSGLKTFSDLLADIYVRYSDVGRAEGQAMAVRLAGNTQLNRLIAMLTSYVTSQRLAVNAQINLNSAEKENQLIVDTLKSRLAGLGAEFERFGMIQGRMPGAFLGQATTGLRNFLAVLNSDAGSVATSATMIGLTALVARMTLFAARSKDAAENGNFFIRSVARGRELMSGAGAAAGEAMSVNSLTGGQQLANWGMFGVGLRADPYSRSALRGMNRYGRTLSATGYATQALGGSAAQTIAGYGMMGAGGAIRGLSGVLAVARSFVPIVGAVYGGLALWNYGMEQLGMSAEKAKAKVAGFSEAAMLAGGRATAFEETARLYGTVARSLAGGMSGQNRTRTLEQLSALESDKFDWATFGRTRGNGEVIVELEARSRRMRQQAGEERYNRFKFEQEGVEAGKSELARLRGSPAAGTKSNLSEQRSLEERILAGEQRKHEIMRQEMEDTEAGLEVSSRYQAALQARETALRQIASVYDLLKGHSPFTAQTAEVASLTHQNQALEDSISRVESSADRKQAIEFERKDQLERTRRGIEMRQQMRTMVGLTEDPASRAARAKRFSKYGFYDPASDNPTANRLGSEVTELEARLQGLERGLIPMAGERDQAKAIDKLREDQRKIQERIEAAKSGVSNAAILGGLTQRMQYESLLGMPSGVGRNRGEELLNQGRWLTGRGEDLKRSAGMTNEARDYVAVLQNALEQRQNILDVTHRQVEVQRDLNKLEYDAARERQRMAISAGPRELLGMLSAHSMAGGMTPAQFTAMSPEMRRMIGLENSKWTGEAMALGQEQKLLGGVPTFDALQGKLNAIDAMIADIQERMKGTFGNVTMPKEATEALTALAGGANSASAALANLTTKTDALALAIGQLTPPNNGGQAPHGRGASGR